MYLYVYQKLIRFYTNKVVPIRSFAYLCIYSMNLSAIVYLYAYLSLYKKQIWSHMTPHATQPYRFKIERYGISRFPLKVRGAVAVGRSGFLGYSVFMLCVSTMAGGSGTEVGVRGWFAGMGPGAIFFVPPCGAVEVLRQLASRSCSIEAGVLI